MRRLLMLCVMVVGCSSECDLAKGLTARSGGGATDCGHAVLGTDASSVDACVVSAFENGTAFVAQYDRMGSDSKVVFGIAGDVNGQVTFLLWDGDPSGGSGVDPVISGNLCVGPFGGFVIDARPFRSRTLDVHVDDLAGSDLRVSGRRNRITRRCRRTDGSVASLPLAPAAERQYRWADKISASTTLSTPRNIQ